MLIKFLVIRFSSIGDIVLTSPVMRCLKNQVDDVHITFLTKPAFKNVVEGNPYIDNIIYLSQSLKQTIQELNNEQFDYIIDLHNNIRTNRIKSKLGIPAFSFKKLNLEKWLLVNFKINKLPQTHIVNRYIDTLSVFDVTIDDLGLEWYFPNNIDYFPYPLFENIKQPYVVFVVGAKHFTKQIPVSLAIDICNEIHKPVILIGGKDEEIAGNSIAIACGDNCISLCGKLNLHESAAVIKNSQLVISPDTGMMHIAAAFNKPIITLWGNTIPEFGMYAFVNENSRFDMQVENLKCRPCSKIGFSKCPKKHFNCMNNQNTQKIIEIANRIIEND